MNTSSSSSSSSSSLDRRSFLSLTGGAASLAAASVVAAESPVAKASESRVLILGIACSPRAGKTTAAAVRTSLEAAAAVNPRISTELIDLGGKRVSGWSPTPVSDDLDAVLARLKDPAFGGLILGSPSYFRSLSSLCKAFIERCYPLREAPAPLADKPVGAMAVGGGRNGGQELVVQQILTAMLSYGMIPVGAEAPALLGGLLWNRSGDDLENDPDGLKTARWVGSRVAKVALRLAAR